MIGTTVSHYKILKKLGGGGMGVVYKAEDLVLGREVALKFLPEALAEDPEALARFQREARSASALSHPHICTIYELGEEDGRSFIVMELMDGQTLKYRLHGQPMSVDEIARIAVQVADALEAAHGASIVHRDIKPANLFVTRRGDAKMLDFGLAKITEDRARAESSKAGAQAETELAQEELTTPGTAMGTVAYMSPEQVLGEELDERTDLFSLGVVLYEMATGKQPFAGGTSGAIFNQILNKAPTAPVRLNPELPDELEHILNKALEKDRALRYQHASDLKADLKRLQRDTTAAVAVERTAAVEPRKGLGKRLRLIGSVTAAVVAVAGLWWFWQRASPAREPATPTPTEISVRSLTSSGKVTCAALSPDGNHLAYVHSYQGEQSLNLREVDGPRDIELIPPRRVSYWDVTFTPDGTGIVFGEMSRDEPTRAFYRISTLGGTARKLLSGIDSKATFSPDGSRMAWVRGRYPTSSESSLMVANADGTEVGALASVQAPERLAGIFFTGPSWSPDGTLIAATVATASEKAELRAFSTTTGETEWTASHAWAWAARVAWLPEGEGLLAIAQSKADAGSPISRGHGQIWFVPYPVGQPVRVTNDLLDYRVLSLSSDGRRLVTVAVSDRSKISVMPRDGSGTARQISHSVVDGRYGLDFLADGRIVFQTLDGTGTTQIAVMNPDGSGYGQLTEETGNSFYPLVTPDDRIVYLTRTTEGDEIWAMDPDGGNRQLLAAVARSYGRPSLSPDGDWFVYSARTEGSLRLWRVPLAGGAPERLTDFAARLATVSPDGSRLAFYYNDPVSGLPQIGVMPFEPGQPELSLDATRPFDQSLLHWADDGKALLFNAAPSDRANLWRLPLDGSEPKRLTDFNDLRIVSVAFSPDGETVALARGQGLRDAVLMEGFR